MEAKVEVKMTPKIMYDFMMYHTYRSFSGIFGDSSSELRHL